MQKLVSSHDLRFKLITKTFITPANGEEIKLRLENPDLTNATSFHQFLNTDQKSITKIVKDKSVFLDASAVAGNVGKIQRKCNV